MVKAVVFNSFGLESLKVEDRETETCAAGMVRVSVRTASLNYRDLLMVKGLYNPRLNLPLIPCSDGSGVITEIGAGVEGLAVGDRVCSTMLPDWEDGDCPAHVLQTTLGGPMDGMLAEERVLPANALLKLPPKIDFNEAACLPVAGLTAWTALQSHGSSLEGARVLLLGTGGVSIMALGIAKKLGATVTITSSSDEKLARAKELGADHVLNYREQPKWSKAVLAANPGGVDIVLEVGGDGTFDQSVKSLRPGGTAALIGVLATANTPVNLTAVVMKAIRVQGILVGSRQHFRSYLDFVAAHRPEYVISDTFEGLDSAFDAFKRMEHGGHFGKMVIQLG